MNIETLTQQLEQKGFNVYEWTENPNTEYPPHQHEGNVFLYIIDGSVEIYFTENKSAVLLSEDDKFNVPPQVEHSAKIGPSGCTFLVGEEIEGDA